jgi:hypothetical protein
MRSRKLEQAELRLTKDGQLEEVFVPLSDKLLSRTIAQVPSYGGSAGRPTWVPSVACGVLREIGKARPNARLVLADFDWLPPPDLAADGPERRSIWSDGEPIVTSMEGIDYECYLNSPHLCDILYPVNFRQLASFVQKTWGNDVVVRVSKQTVFLYEYGQSEVESTKSWLTGYSPLLHDFGNCSVLTVTRRETDSDMNSG